MDQTAQEDLFPLSLKYEHTNVCVRRECIDWGQSQFFHGSKLNHVKYKCVCVSERAC